MSDSSYPVVRITNTSATGRFFGFIPPHGKYLDIGEYIDVEPEIWDRIKLNAL